MMDLGEIKPYLEVHITYNRSIKYLEIDQSRYISEILDWFGIVNANLMYTPLSMGADVHLVKHEGQATESEIKDYQ
jgi:hypothetical protein